MDNTYAWIGPAFAKVMRDEVCTRKPQYAWGVLQGAALGRVLGFARVSVLELGVAGGAGLVSLEHTARRIEELAGIGVDVYGFDSGVGLPQPRDYRDQPNMWIEGQLPMRRDVVERLLDRASLRIGLVADTIPVFLDERPAPIAFLAFDLDLYSSTRDALAILLADPVCLLPRIPCYFDDIIGHSYNDFTGERLAINEFNAVHERRKLSPMYGLRYFVPPEFEGNPRWECMFFAHLFDHPLYCVPDSYRKAIYVDENGAVVRAITADWQLERLAGRC